MKGIKKVEVTPLDYNVGKIINSASTTDDKTKNTYSMEVINNKINYGLSALSNDVIHEEAIRVLYGTITTPEAGSSEISGTTTINYPDGWHSGNCEIISVMCRKGTGLFNYWSTTSSVYDARTALNGNYNLYAQLAASGVFVSVDKGNTANSSQTIEVKVILMNL